MFEEMTDDEFLKAQDGAREEMWSLYAQFARRTVGYRFLRNGVAVPKYVLFHRFKYYPRQLEMLILGRHPDYVKRMNANYDDVIWEQLGLELPRETDRIF